MTDHVQGPSLAKTMPTQSSDPDNGMKVESADLTGPLPEEADLPASSLAHQLMLEELEGRLQAAHRREKRHLLWVVLGLSPAAVIPALGLLSEGSFGLFILLVVLVTASQLISWNLAAREAERLEKELSRLRHGE